MTEKHGHCAHKDEFNFNTEILEKQVVEELCMLFWGEEEQNRLLGDGR